MDKETSLIKSPDLINLNDTDTDAEIQYKSLDHTNGDAAADTDEPHLSGDSPSASSPASDSPKQTDSGRAQWQTTLSEERRQLLATEGESSDRHSSDEEVDVWTVSGEQRQYYTQQFLTLQPELTGLIPGHTAKAFFEKSKLPVTALSKIWNLSDVTRDGCLCLEEFITAMHLVVLRRNRIEVPDVLPTSLVPKVPLPRIPEQSPLQLSVSSAGAAAAAAASAAPAPPAATQVTPAAQLTSPKGKEWTKFVESPMSNISSPGIKPVNFDFHKSAVEQNPQILHPVAVKGGSREDQNSRRVPGDSDGDLSEGSELAAPTQPPPQPQPLTTRPAVRAFRQSSGGPPGSGDSGPTSLPVLAQTAPALPCRVPQPAPAPPPPPPPPRPSHGSHARSSSLDLSRMPPPQPPPVVPPRSSPADAPRAHGRPSLPAAPESGGFADFSQFQEPAQELATRSRPGAFQEPPPQEPRGRQGAFEVYKKPAAAAAAAAVAAAPPAEPVPAAPGSRLHHASAPAAGEQPAPAAGAARPSRTEEPRPPEPAAASAPDPAAITPEQLARMTVQEMLALRRWPKEALQQLIRTQKERTAVLAQVTAELNQELAEAVEERTALELQLDHMKPDND